MKFRRRGVRKDWILEGVEVRRSGVRKDWILEGVEFRRSGVWKEWSLKEVESGRNGVQKPVFFLDFLMKNKGSTRSMDFRRGCRG